jgi:hypothetical protein
MIINANSLNFNTTQNSFATKPFAPKENTSNESQTSVNQDIFTLSADVLIRGVRFYDSSNGINWGQVTESLASESYSIIGDVGEYLNKASEMYASLETRINEKFTGEERTEQLQALNDTFKQILDNYVEEYLIKSGSRHMVRMGVDFPENEIRESILGIFAGRSDTVFSATDLTALGLVAAGRLSSPIFSNLVDGNTGTVGLELSLFSLSTNEIMNKMGVSDKMRGLLNNYVESYTEYYTNVAEKVEQRMAELAERLGKRFKYKENHVANTNIRNEINALLDLTKELYSSEKSKVEMLQAIFALAYEQNKFNPSGFWNNFYDNGDGESVVGKLITQWDNFSTALNREDYKGVVDSMRGISSLLNKNS